MQKKVINRFLALLAMVILTACSSLQGPQQDETDFSNDKTIFVDSSISPFMGKSDYIKLQRLVATAQPEQFISWYSTRNGGVRFDFISQRIFVNAKGEGCRDYELKMNKWFFDYSVFSYTACRDSQGEWDVIKQIK